MNWLFGIVKFCALGKNWGAFIAMLIERGSRYVYGIVSIVVIMQLQGMVPDSTDQWVCRSQEQGEGVTCVTPTSWQITGPITSSPPLLCDAPGHILNNVKIFSDHGKWLSCARTEYYDCMHWQTLAFELNSILHCIVLSLIICDIHTSDK